MLYPWNSVLSLIGMPRINRRLLDIAGGWLARKSWANSAFCMVLKLLTSTMGHFFCSNMCARGLIDWYSHLSCQVIILSPVFQVIIISPGGCK